MQLLDSPDDEVKNTVLQALWMLSFQPECKDKYTQDYYYHRLVGIPFIYFLKKAEKTGDC